jgi:hypothetical protein
LALLQGQKAWRVLARWLLGALDPPANTGVQQADPPLLAVSDGFVAIPKGFMLLEHRLDFRSDHGVSYLLLSKRLPLHTGVTRTATAAGLPPVCGKARPQKGDYKLRSLH